MSIVLSDTVRQKIKDYHRYHGDKSVKILRVIQDSEGYDAVLVRVINSNGEKYSCVDLIDLEGDVAELTSVKTEYELDMVKNFEES